MKNLSFVIVIISFVLAGLATAQDKDPPGAEEARQQVDEAAKDAAKAAGEATEATQDEANDAAKAAEDGNQEKDENAEQPAGDAAPDKGNGLKTDQQRHSYAIGVSIGRGLKRDGAEVDAALIGQGIADAIEGSDVKLTDDEIRAAIIGFRRALLRKQADKANAGKAEGLAFLEENKGKEGVESLPSGLQYRVIKQGDGASPKAEDVVKVHYHGTLVDGTVFDSSVERGEPATFPVNKVIEGWQQALKKMKVGDKWELVIPPELAYADRGSPPKIGPGAVLKFEVELLGIE